MLNAITRVAFRCGDALASPWTILFFAIVSLTALPQTLALAVAHGDVTVLVGWFSQNFVQLVSLAILAFIADRQGRAARDHAEEMYGWWRETHTALHSAHEKLDGLHDKADALNETIGADQ